MLTNEIREKLDGGDRRDPRGQEIDSRGRTDSFLAQAYEAIGDIPQAETHLLAWQKKNRTT